MAERAESFSETEATAMKHLLKLLDLTPEEILSGLLGDFDLEILIWRISSNMKKNTESRIRVCRVRRSA